MKTTKQKSLSTHSLKMQIVSSLVLSVMVLSVGVLCLSAAENSLKTDGKEADVYRSADASSTGVSLMFNVYWGTEEVYQILDILKTNEAKATFFIGGCWADDNVDCLREIYAQGHEIGNHGYFHKDHSKMSLVENQKEITSCNRFIELAIGEKPTLFAPPSGAYGENALNACRQLSMKTILWSRDTIDWRDKDASLIYSRATKNIKGGEFVLMHPMAHTVKALDDILEYYKSQSLSAVTVTQNLQIKNQG